MGYWGVTGDKETDAALIAGLQKIVQEELLHSGVCDAAGQQILRDELIGMQREKEANS